MKGWSAPGAIFDSKMFSVSREASGMTLLVAEASDGIGHARATGFCVRSHRTGAVVRFVFARAEYDREGDLQVEIYIPAMAQPRAVEVHILND